MKRSNIVRHTPLRRVSRQKAEDNVTYAVAKQEWREDRIRADGYHRCQVVQKDGKPPAMITDEKGRCMREAHPSPHHKAGRVGQMLSYKRYFMACCAECHQFIHENARWARKRGYLMNAQPLQYRNMPLKSLKPPRQTDRWRTRLCQ